MSNPKDNTPRTRKAVPAILMAAGAVGLTALASYSVFHGPADAYSASPDFLAETAMLRGQDAAQAPTPTASSDTASVPADGAPRAPRARRITPDVMGSNLDFSESFVDFKRPKAGAADQPESAEANADDYEFVEPAGFEKPADKIELPESTLSQVAAAVKPFMPVIEPVTEEAPALEAETMPVVGTAPVAKAAPVAPAEPIAPVIDMTSPAASTRDVFVRAGLSKQGDVRMPVAGSQVLTTNRPFTRVSVGSPDIAEVNPLGSDSLLVTAKSAGHTQLIIWDDDERSEMIQVAVEPDFAALRDALSVAFPNEKVEITPVGNTVAIRGRVTDTGVAQQILEVASAFSDGVVNLLEVGGGQTVMLRVRFAEVSRDMSRQLGINFGFQDGPTIFGSNIGNVAPLGLASGPFLQIPVGVSPGAQAFGTGTVDGSPFAFFINALKDANLLRMLSEPNVTVMSGETGTMLAGGEIPIPVPQEQNVTIEYKEFGVRLDYTPLVLGDGRIRLTLKTRSSDLDFSRAVTISGLQIPALRTKENSTVVEMADGQTLMIGGLLENRVTANRQSVPGLGELPVIGALFRSVRYERAETELVVMVTPVLVEAMNPAETIKPAGTNWRHPSDYELYGEGNFGEDISAMPEEMPMIDAEVIDAATVGEADQDAKEGAIDADRQAEERAAVSAPKSTPVVTRRTGQGVVVVEPETVETEVTPVDDQMADPVAAPVVAPVTETPIVDKSPRQETAVPTAIEVLPQSAARPEWPNRPQFIGFIGFTEQ